MITGNRFTKRFLEKLNDFPGSKIIFLCFIGVGASYKEAMLNTAKYYKIEPEYEEYHDDDILKIKEGK